MPFRDLSILVNTAGFDLGPVYGTRLMALIMCWTLWGISCVQMFLYFVNYPKDSIWMKMLVIWVWSLDTAHQILLLKAAYDSFVLYFGDATRALSIIPEEVWELLPQTLVAITVQGFLVYRIFKFSRDNWIFPILFSIMALFQFSVCVAYLCIANASSSDGFSGLATSLILDLSIAYLAVACAVDILIAVTMCYLLMQSRGADGVKATTRLIERLAILSINTGAWTALFALLSIAIFRAYPTTLDYVVFDFTICPLYVNTILANLNLRQTIRGKSFDVVPGTNSTGRTINLSDVGRRKGGKDHPNGSASMELEAFKAVEGTTSKSDSATLYSGTRSLPSPA